MSFENNYWKFMKGDVTNAFQKDFNDNAWREVRVPHDYAIEGPFAPENDRQVQSVIADGIREPIVHVGRTGSLPITDHAWYRKTFIVSENAKNVFIEFDGVMCNSNVFVNGTKCGGRVYGYSSFSVDITKACILGDENVVAVSLTPEPCSSRWYSGAGIYRNVRLIEKKDMFFPYLPAYIKTEVVGENAKVNCEIKVKNNEQAYELVMNVLDAEKNIVASKKVNSSSNCVCEEFKIANFKKWDILNSYLYTMEVELLENGTVTDTYETTFGIRTISFDANKGFFLNGKNHKLKGVCLHHDAGALGAAVNRNAIKRQLEKLVEMGTNSIRCSHNPPATELLDLCDEMGLVVIDEAFDEWKVQKVANGYGKHFDDCAYDDISTMVIRDRNHPCIIMWSIGNEILEQRNAEGRKVAQYLNNICHEIDNTRPTTAGFNMSEQAFEHGMVHDVDIVGLNYKPHLYEKYHKDFPDLIIYGSETSSCVSSRGEYYLPAEVNIPTQVRETLHVNSYDLDAPPWAYYPEREFVKQDDCEFIFGEYVWTGFDYIGEPTPHRDNWPSRSSYFGIFDLAGIEKDRYYSYKAQWTDKEVLHLFPHWNWNEGDVVDVHCYSSFDKVELFVNDVSQGICEKVFDDEIRRYRLIWKDIKFEAGEIRAVAVEKPEVCDIVKTAGEMVSIKLEPEKTIINADGDDLAYIRCTAFDANGVVCPKEMAKFDIEVSGAGEYLASDNGDQTSTRIFSEKYCELFNGKAMIILRSIKGETGEVKIKIKNEITSSEVTISAE